MANYARGRAYEYAVRDSLVADGYKVLRSAASKGDFDLVAYDDALVVFVQVKTGKAVSRDECERFAEAARDLPPCARAQLWHVNKERHVARIYVVGMSHNARVDRAGALTLNSVKPLTLSRSRKPKEVAHDE